MRICTVAIRSGDVVPVGTASMVLVGLGEGGIGVFGFVMVFVGVSEFVTGRVAVGAILAQL